MSNIIQSFNQAIFLQENKKYSEAINCYQKILRDSPDHLASLINLSALLKTLKKNDEAVNCYEKIIKIKADYVPIIINYGNTLYDLNRYDEALIIYTNGLKYHEHLLLLLNGIANCCIKKKDYWHAIAYLHWALSEDAQDRITHYNLANTYFLMGDYNKTESILTQLKPSSDHAQEARFFLLLAKTYQKKQQYQQAIDLLISYQAQNLENITQAKIANLIGKNYGELEQFSEARKWLEQAVKLNPSYADAHYHLANVLAESGDFDQATTLYQHVLKLNPDVHQARLNLALNELMTDHWRAGFEQYGARWQVEEYQKQKRYFNCPEWQGELLQNKKLIIWGEQGIGDEIMFALFFKSARQVTNNIEVICRNRLVSLFERSFPALSFVGVGSDKDKNINQSQAVHVAMGDLPRWLWHRSEHYLGLPYLKVNEDEKQRFIKEYAAQGKKRIGISWFGGRDKQKTRRSTSLNSWVKLCSAFKARAEFYSLQYNVSKEDKKQLNSMGIIVIEEIDPMKNMDQFASFMAGLDLVISVDNSTVHLAGALGVPCWVLLPKLHEWRWSYQGSESIWYDSLYLFKNTHDREWEQVMDCITEKMKTYTQSTWNHGEAARA